MSRPAEASPPLTPAIAERLAGRPFVALLDIDGTLAPIASRPEGAVVPADTRQVVAALAALPKAIVVAVSGRAAHDAARVLGVPGAWIIGNHGLEIAPPDGPPRPLLDLEPYVAPLASARDEMRAFAAAHAGVIIEDKRWTLSVHYRLANAVVVDSVVRATKAIAERLGLRATLGRRVVEIRPPVAVDKGTASVDLLRRVSALGPNASVFCAGDDRTDEDMFRGVRAANARAVTVRVASDDDSPDRARDESSAELTVATPDALREMLAAIVDLRRP